MTGVNGSSSSNLVSGRAFGVEFHPLKASYPWCEVRLH
jgi:hypothetical protein